MTVATKKHSYQFSPKDPVVRTNVSLMIGAFGHLYIWPISSLLEVAYSADGAPVNLQAIPYVKARPIDETVEKILTSVAFAAKRGTLEPSKLANPSTDCPDCFIFMQRRKPKSASDPAVWTVDPWQQNPDYTDWVDPTLTTVPSQTEPPPGGIRPMDCTWYSSGPWSCSGSSWDACQQYWYCAWWNAPWWYFYDPQWGGGGYDITNDPAGCALDQNYCDFTDGDYTNDLAYSDGAGGLYTHYPWDCIYTPGTLSSSGTVYTSTTDHLSCSTWQVFHYFDMYCDYGGNCNSINNSGLPHGIINKISIGINNVLGGSADSGYWVSPGHLYIQYWTGAGATFLGFTLTASFPTGTPLQAGPEFDNVSCCVPGDWGKLVERQDYPVSALSGLPFRQYFLPIASSNAQTAATTFSAENANYAHHTACCAPPYFPLVPNSNTWVAGLLDHYGYSQLLIDAYMLRLQATSTYDPYGAAYGSTISGLFAP